MVSVPPTHPGTAVSSAVERMLTDMAVELDAGLVPLAIYNHPDVYRLELERIFARAWIFVAHESEIPTRDDYVVRYIGEDPWIVVRDATGVVRVLFDSCRHRGTQVCRADMGNATYFRCPYHGWTYKNTGELVGVPSRQEAYKLLDLAEWSLLRAPRVATYQGLIFASLDTETPDLDEYLGDFRWYLDLHLGLAPDGMDVIGPPHRWQIDADWKSAAENFSGDSYHTPFLHRSILGIGIAPQAPPLPMGERASPHQHITECSGHASSMRRAAPGQAGFWGYPPEVTALFTDSRLTPAQYELARTTINSTGNVFPNLSFIHAGMTDAPGRDSAGYLSLRQWQPRGPGKMEAWSWTLVPKRASAAYRERAGKVAVATFSPSGNFEQDDVIAWNGAARAARSVFATRVQAKLNYQMGLPGMSAAQPVTDWPGPGIVYDSNLEEGVQRTFLRHWLTDMLRPWDH